MQTLKTLYCLNVDANALGIVIATPEAVETIREKLEAAEAAFGENLTQLELNPAAIPGLHVLISKCENGDSVAGEWKNSTASFAADGEDGVQVHSINMEAVMGIPGVNLMYEEEIGDEYAYFLEQAVEHTTDAEHKALFAQALANI